MPTPIQKPGRSRQDYETPRDLIAAVKRRFYIYGFWIDLAASASNKKADRFYDDSNGGSLSKDWGTPGGGIAWLNPPYADITPWVRKAYKSRPKCTTIMLLPASVGSNWYRDWVEDKAVVLFLNGRIKFVGCSTYYPKDCMILCYSTWSHALQPRVWRWNVNGNDKA